MKIANSLAEVPEKAYVMVFFGIFLVATLSAYFVKEDTDLLEKSIYSKQRDLGQVLQLRDAYETKKRESERSAPTTTGTQEISLALIEETAAKNFVGGTLASLQPAATKEGKGNKGTAVEIKVTGAALGEVVSFVKATESAGLRVEKLRLSIPASNASALDMQATITEGGSHG